MGTVSTQLLLRTVGGPKSLSLPHEGIVRVGSRKPCQIVLTEAGVLPAHCFIKCAGGKAAVIVQDPAATVLVNGSAVQKYVLRDGDTLQIGDAVLDVGVIQHDPFLGETIGGHRVEALLGRGAMGSVYKAVQISLERDVALKILSPERTRDEAFVRRFLEEARAAAKLNHPHVVQIFDVGSVPSPIAEQPGQLYYISMELLAGGTLQKALDRDGRLPVARALAVGRDALKALAWAQEQGLVHRDIKPANLLFAPDGSIKIADLGIAADVDRMMEGVQGLDGAGSPRYMAPEQTQKKGVDHRADLYALGATLFRTIAGRHVFAVDGVAEVIRTKLTQDAPRLDSLVPDVPRALADLVAQMLARDPARRPRGCREALGVVERVLLSLETGEAAELPVADDEVALDPLGSQEEVAEEAEGTGLEPATGGGPGATRIRRDPPRRSAGGWAKFFRSTPGRVNLCASLLLVLLASFVPLGRGGPGEQVGAEVPRVEGAPTRRGQPAAGEAASTASGKGESPKAPGAREATAAVPGPAATSPDPAAAAPVAGVDRAIQAQIAGIVKEYRSGLIDARRAIAALEDLKRKQSDPGAQGLAEGSLRQIRDNEVEAGKAALARLTSGDLPRLLEKGELREAVSRLVKVAQAHPLSQKEVNAEVDKVEAVAAERLQKAVLAADQAAAEGNYAAAVETLSQIATTLPLKAGAEAEKKLKALEAAGREYEQHAVPLRTKAEALQVSLTALDFDSASTLASSLPRPNVPALSKLRASAALEVTLAREAWQVLAAAAARAGRNAEPVSLLAQPASELKALLGGAAPASQLEGLGLLVLYQAGPQAAQPLLQDTRLKPEAVAAYKLRLQAEEALHLPRWVKGISARLELLKKQRGLPPNAWVDLSNAILQKIRVAKKTPGYETVKKDLGLAFLRAKAEVLRPQAPQCLFRGKIKTQKPDGFVEIVYEFTSDEELGDFFPVKGVQSRIERDGKTAKLRGELRFGRGNVFRARVGLSAKLPPDSVNPQSPNLNLALWTQESDRVSPAIRRAGGAEVSDTPGTVDGEPRDYFVFALGYRVRPAAQDAPETLSVRGGGSVAMPANAIFGGIRGSSLLTPSEPSCLWAKASGRMSGTQTFRVAMAAGVPTWTSSSQSLPGARELRELPFLRREGPYLGSITLFSNGEVHVYESLTIEGELNPEWIDERLLELGREELKKVD